MGSEWENLRALHGSRELGFEELCRQLARSETPSEAKFVPVGSPDAGVECYASFQDGSKWGWQAKFFRSSLSPSQWVQIDGSVRSALDAHSSLVRYYVCVPRNRSHSPRSDITTEMQKWDSRVAKWGGWASERGMDVDFVWWGDSELWDRLSQPQHIGRERFWFRDRQQFSADWFKQRFEGARKTAGPRYTPEVHIDLPLAHRFELFGRSQAAADSVRGLAEDVRRNLPPSLGSLDQDNYPGERPPLSELAQLSERIVEQLSATRNAPDDNWPLADAVEDVGRALALVEQCEGPLDTAARAYEDRGKADEPGYHNRLNPYKETAHGLRRLENALYETLGALIEFDKVTNCRWMLVTGEAGAGKTHLLCDIAHTRIDEQRPTVILMGQRFTTTDPPWIQVLNQLDVSNLSAAEFVGALEAAAQAANKRAIFIVDAINEGHGYTVWRAHLSDFLSYLEGSPWIGVVLSVRSPYVNAIVPSELRATAYELEHTGFAGQTYDAVREFSLYYGLEFPSMPILRPEFDNPLFLKMLCEGLQASGLTRIPAGSTGITSLFERYLSGINERLAAELNYDLEDQKIGRALARIAEAFADRNTRELPRRHVQTLVDPLANSIGFTDSMYRALVDNGLLIESPSYRDDEDLSVSVAFEWFADHLIVTHLIEKHVDQRDPVAAFRSDGLLETLAADRAATWPGLLEALCVQLPERRGIELPDILSEGAASASTTRALLRSLVSRDAAAIGADCQRLVDELFSQTEPRRVRELFDALLACAAVPGHPFGAEYLDKRLRGIVLPDRDALWSTYLHHAYGRGGPVDRLLDWGEQQAPAGSSIDPEVAVMCATVLAWFLTASDRFVRDRATKALVALTGGRFALLEDLVERFHGVDDPYVCERLFAVAYGASMRTADGTALEPLAALTYRLIFACGEPPPHILLRDYARGVIERAQHLGADIDVDEYLVTPPYGSAWPHIPDDDELERVAPEWRDVDMEPSNAEVARSWIRHSVMSWDFARYVIGTNSRSKSVDWLAVPLDERQWHSARERMDAFEASLAPASRRLLVELRAGRRPSRRWISFVSPDDGTVDDDPPLPESASAVEEPYTDPDLEESLLASLTDAQGAEYRSIKAAEAEDEPRLDLAILQRYILGRVFDLGWTTDRFGDFDRRIGRTGSHVTQKPERIGKKYQWIAYHEILAYISDCFQYRANYSDAKPFASYAGPWQFSIRDIDPSVTYSPSYDEETSLYSQHSWWTGPSQADWCGDLSPQEWLRRDDDLPDPHKQLQITHDADGIRWLKIQGATYLEQPSPAGLGGYEADRRVIRIFVTGYIVDSAMAEAFLEWSKATDLWEITLPEPPTPYQLFFGELDWGAAFTDILADYVDEAQPRFLPGTGIMTSLRPVAAHYVAERGGYDCSFRNTYSLYVPQCALTQAMKLQWTGYGADFTARDGEIVVMDPSAHESGPTALLIRQDRLQSFLDASESALIWTIIGEKMFVRGRTFGDWGGSRRFSGAFRHDAQGLEGEMSTRLIMPGDDS